MGVEGVDGIMQRQHPWYWTSHGNSEVKWAMVHIYHACTAFSWNPTLLPARIAHGRRDMDLERPGGEACKMVRMWRSASQENGFDSSPRQRGQEVHRVPCPTTEFRLG